MAKLFKHEICIAIKRKRGPGWSKLGDQPAHTSPSNHTYNKHIHSTWDRWAPEGFMKEVLFLIAGNLCHGMTLL